VPDLAEAIRAQMRNGGEPITFEAVAALDTSGLEVPRLRRRRQSPVARTTPPSGRTAQSLRFPAIAWAGLLLALVLVAVVVGVSVSASHSPSTTTPAHHGPGPRTTRPSVPQAHHVQTLTVPNVDEHSVEIPGSPGEVVQAQSPVAGSQVRAGSVVEIYARPRTAFVLCRVRGR
jgi:hypothetical protein